MNITTKISKRLKPRNIIYTLALILFLLGVNYFPYDLKLSLKPSSQISEAQGAELLDIWWPLDGKTMTGVHPFKALINGAEINSYKMYWQVDGGNQVLMDTSYTDYPHKEALVDLSGWKWKNNGPYTVTFTAKDLSGKVLSQRSISIKTGEAEEADKNTEPVKPSPTPFPSISTAPETKPETVPFPSNSSNPASSTESAQSKSTINVWWPLDKSKISGTHPLKALLENNDVNKYKMFWSVDGGNKVEMYNSYTDYPHKEAQVNFDGWNWKGSDAYVITFTAKDFQGKVLAEKKISLYMQSSGTPNTPSTPVTNPPAQVTPPAVVTPNNPTTPETPADSNPTPDTSIPSSSGNPFSGSKLYVNPNSDAKKQADAWRNSNPSDAAQMDKIASGAEVKWFGNWNSNIEEAVRSYVSENSSQNALPVFVAYNIPGRDCGSYSAGGEATADGYRTWIKNMAKGIGSNKAVVILEPDAVPGMDCLNQADQNVRLSLLSEAVDALKANGKTIVYIDAGNARWKPADETASRLIKAGVAKADGFSLNVSNFITTEESTKFGSEVSAKLNGKHFVIDTSRNGSGSNWEWCNPQGRSLGQKPTTSTGNSIIDAYLWIKKPGESDGTCSGGPSAGVWWLDYALDLAKRTTY